jgi:hypothetical protein
LILRKPNPSVSAGGGGFFAASDMVMRKLRRMVFFMPIFAWLIHLLVIVPMLGEQDGGLGFGLAITFFFYATIAMLIGLVVAVVLFLIERKLLDLLAVLLNLSWLYYVKVLFWGTTMGNF